ncbi:MAG: hypothetical protein N3A72_05375 [bacterium]|nr:hypothetical protein [bacterium]
MKRCYNCGEPYQESHPFSFQSTCGKCHAYLHCCYNCRLYDPNASNKCKSSTTEWVTNRQKYNFCEEFEFAESEPKRQPSKEETKAKFDNLFKK